MTHTSSIFILHFYRKIRKENCQVSRGDGASHYRLYRSCRGRNGGRRHSSVQLLGKQQQSAGWVNKVPSSGLIALSIFNLLILASAGKCRHKYLITVLRYALWLDHSQGGERRAE